MRRSGETVTIKVQEANPKGEADWKLLSTCSAPQSASRRRSVMRCARAIEGRSPEFRSYRRMSPWNSKQERFCDVFPVASLTILLLKDVP